LVYEASYMTESGKGVCKGGVVDVCRRLADGVQAPTALKAEQRKKALHEQRPHRAPVDAQICQQQWHIVVVKKVHQVMTDVERS
jgi:hypothetical protein